MRILLSNDDGIHAKGLHILEQIALTLSDDVWIVAPELDQSGASHSLTLRDPLRIREVVPKRFAVNGTPTDCVMIGVNHILREHKPDLILSGVNYGANLADDAIYSGTVAAAMEGALLDIPSIALSLVVDYKSEHPAFWETALEHAPDLLKKLLVTKLPTDILTNINFPCVASEHVQGVRVVPQGLRHMKDNLLMRKDPRGNPYYWIGALAEEGELTPNTDLHASRENFITITPLSFHLTHKKSQRILEEIFPYADAVNHSIYSV